MRYADSVQRSAEYLRLALPLMAQHGLAVNPFNYAVWYDYVSGGNPELKREIDTLTERGVPITNQLCEAIYHRHIAQASEQKLFGVHTGVRRLIDQVQESVTEADNRVARFDDSLLEHGSRLETGGEDMGTVHEVVSRILDETRQMHASNTELRDQLNESAGEIERLRTRLQKTQKEAISDALTGLANRKALSDAFQKMTEEEDLGDLALLMIDIDHFKQVNDNYGHLLGDKVLKAVSGAIQSCIKGRDIGARWGGEEFVVLLPDTPFEGACTLAEAIRRMIERSKIRRMNSDEAIDRVTVSIGVAGYQPGDLLDDLIQRADRALYRSKRSGRNRVSSEAVTASDRT